MKKNIMIVIPDLSGGGAERVATNLATCLSKTENVILVVEHLFSNTYGSTVETIDLNMPQDKGKLKVFWHLKLAHRLKKVKKERNITHCICFLQEAALACVISKGKEKLFISVRNKLSSQLNRILILKEKFTFKYADGVIALSRMVKEDLISEFGVNPNKVTAIYNPCYNDAIKSKIVEGSLSEEEQRFFYENKGNIVLTAGRLTDQKGQWHLIRAFSKVVKKIPNAKLIVLGQGENKCYLESLIKNYDLTNNIYILGYKENPYIYMNKSDVFAFSSLYEGLGNIVVECMACELPVISVDYEYGARELLMENPSYDSAIDDILFSDYGIIVPRVDGVKYKYTDELTYAEDKLADAIVLALNDESIRVKYKEKIKKRALKFNPELITNEWKQFLDTTEI